MHRYSGSRRLQAEKSAAVTGSGMPVDPVLSGSPRDASGR
jgi:hypothetical protein